MLTIADEIIQSGKVTDNQGKEYPLHSHTSKNQCRFLQKVISEIDAKICLEIGLAYGISALHICEAIQKKTGRIFYTIDPFQKIWNYIGINNLEKANTLSFVNFYEDFSHNVLPKLMIKGVKIDFAYVDTSKLFDVVFVDAYYLSLMLRIGGVMIFDDCVYPGVRKLIRYLTKVPNLKIYGRFDTFNPNKRLNYLNRICRLLPMNRKVFNQRVIEPEETLGVNANCIAFQKVSGDRRNWDWFEDF